MILWFDIMPVRYLFRGAMLMKYKHFFLLPGLIVLIAIIIFPSAFYHPRQLLQLGCCETGT